MVTENQVRKVARDCSLVFNALGDPNRCVKESQKIHETPLGLLVDGTKIG
jgi:hypothetical protein